MNRINRETNSPQPPTTSGAALELLQRIAEAIERLEENQDAFFGEYLNRKYPYGRPTDKWRRSA